MMSCIGNDTNEEKHVMKKYENMKCVVKCKTKCADIKDLFRIPFKLIFCQVLFRLIALNIKTDQD